MRPEFVFLRSPAAPAGRALPSGSWAWVVYEVTDARHALELAGRGVAMVESMTPVRLAGELASREPLPA